MEFGDFLVLWLLFSLCVSGYWVTKLIILMIWDLIRVEIATRRGTRRSRFEDIL